MFNGIIRDLKQEDVPVVERIFDLYWSDAFRKNLSRKLKSYIEESPELVEQRFTFVVAEDGGEVVGVAAIRNAPADMKTYSSTERPGEFYVVAVKTKGKGVGSTLRTWIVEEAKRRGYTELVFFSGDTHQDAWAFHDHSSFVRAGEATAPDGEKGLIWRMVF